MLAVVEARLLRMLSIGVRFLRKGEGKGRRFSGKSSALDRTSLREIKASRKRKKVGQRR